MSRLAVLGLGFGDEGKGMVTDYLCSQSPASTMVVRFSGGHQAAHTVCADGAEHVFSNFGSGTLRGCLTYWSKHCTFEPVGFCVERKFLTRLGKIPQIIVDASCPVTTPYDIFANQISPERAHGTTGVGFWKTIERNRRGVTLTFADIFEGERHQLEGKLLRIAKYYGFVDNIQPGDFYWAVDLIKSFHDKSVYMSTVGCSSTFKSFVFEGSQGLLLDKDLGFFPHVTPSKTNLENIFELGYGLDGVYLVTRAYQTRHGVGPMTNESLPLQVRDDHERSTKTNEFQGSLRKTVLDLDLLESVVHRGVDEDCRQHSITKHLVVTCLDQIQGFPTLTYGGQVRKFQDAKSFVTFIGDILGIDGLRHGNYSPSFDKMKVF